MFERRLSAGWAIPLALLLAAGAAGAVTETETLQRSYPFAGGDRLELRNTNGSIQITTWDRNEVRIVAEKKVRAGSRARAEEILKAVRIEIDESPDGVSIETRYPRSSDGIFSWLFGRSGSASVSYEITLPKRADLDVGTVNGKVRVSAVHGRLRIRSTNGSLEIDDAGGSLDARTTNGAIRAELLEVVSGEDLSLTTTNGGIRLALPAGIRADLSAGTTNGSIETDFPIAVHGRLSRRSLDGTINGGGGRIDLSTTNGAIRIEEI